MSPHIVYRAVLSLLLVVAFAVPPVAAVQDTATVVGTVRDEQGGVLPGATVTARNTNTGFSRVAVSDAEGRYRLPALPPGPYELTAELSGFGTSVRRGVTLALGAEVVISFDMRLAGLAEAVTVTADSPVVETTTAAVQKVISRETIEILPSIGRDYLTAATLAPGAQSSNGLSFVGSRGRSNQWHIDGVDNSEDISGYSRQSPPIDSIQEVQVMVTGFKAEYGAASGGVINAVTRTGTNVLRGTAFTMFRNEALMSRDPYADRSLPKDPFRRLHYGATVGGPVQRDRLHFFGTYEREDRDTFSASTFELPSAASLATAAESTRQFLARHGIDPALFGEGGRRRLTRPEYVDVHRASLRFDRQITAAQSVTAAYRFSHDRQPSGQGGTLLDFNGATAFFRTNYGNLNHKWVLRSNMLNELYVQFGQSHGDWFVSYPSLPNVTITGGPSIGGPSNYPQGRTDHILQVNNALTWTTTTPRWGEHVLKAGVQMKIFRSDSFFDSNFRGTYTFPSMTAFLQGRPSRFTQNRGDTALARPNDILGFYIQDDWRVSPSLTLNLGLRYDYEGAETEALRDVDGRPGPGIGGDRNNVAPRFGFAWAPGGSTRQVFYGGTGIYYDQVILNVIGNARFTPPKVIGVQIDNPAWPDPTAGGSAVIPPPSLSIIDPDLVTPWNWNSQFGYRRELAEDLGLDVSLVYNRGYDHIFIVNTNAGEPGSATITGTGARRPDPTVTNKSFYSNLGEIRYRGLLVDLTKRLSAGFSAGVNYTLSKTTDNSFNFVSGLQVPERPDLNWGPGADDRRHRVAGYGDVRLPFDVDLGFIVEWRTRAPLNITAGGRDLNGDGITGDWVHEEICRTIACQGFRYSRNSVRQLSTDEANRLRALFGLAPIEEFHNNPRYFNADVTLQKRVRIGRQTLRGKVEAINVFNIPQRTLPGQNILSGLFGTYTSVEQPRAVQFTLHLDW